MDRTWFRLDRTTPREWSWAPYATARHRFDSAAGLRRVRYAASSQRGVLREAFDATGRILGEADLESHLVRLSGRLRLLDLRREATLDALGLDDQVSTGRAPEVWTTCQRLADLAAGHYGVRLHGIVYRSRTTPQTNTNLALFAQAQMTAETLGPLRTHSGLLAAAVVGDGFTVEAADGLWG